jgi:RNA polymerase sigma-70 factor (ECF subfamily)
MAEPAPVSPSDLARLRAQDAAAFTALVEQTRRIVLGLGQSVGLSGADLEDATAEAYLAVFRALPGFAGNSAVTTWVYTNAARTLAHWKTRERKKSAATLPAGELADGKSDSPAMLAERAETNQKLWDAVAKLEPRSAMAVELFYRRGLDVEAVASVLDCPAGTVKTMLFRARAVLKQKLEAAYA